MVSEGGARRVAGGLDWELLRLRRVRGGPLSRCGDQGGRADDGEGEGEGLHNGVD